MEPLEVHRPRTIAEAVALKASLPESMYVAGGTDLLPNLKHRLHRPAHLVSLSQIDELAGVQAEEDGSLRLGAGVSLEDLSRSEAVRARVPALAQAAGLVAGPQHRRMGTLGGNVMLDTRCLFYNQSESWREALGFCLKKDGTWCHVIGSGRRCVAAHSSDTVPVLLALGATLEVNTPEGLEHHDLRDVFHQDGRYDLNRRLSRDALVTAVRVPVQAQEHRSVYRKVRPRASVDFPQLGLALVAAFDGEVITHLAGAVSALMPKPRVLTGLDAAVGHRLTEDLVEDLAEKVFKQSHPQTSVNGDPSWRKAMARVEARRALEALRRPRA